MLPRVRQGQLQPRLGKDGAGVAEQGFQHLRLAELGQHGGDGVGDFLAPCDDKTMQRRARLCAGDQVRRGDGGVGQQQFGHLDLVADQHAQKIGRNYGQAGHPLSDPPAVRRGGVAQHLDEEVRRHGALEGVHPAGRQADHVRQPLDQSHPRTTGRRLNR